MTSGPPEKPSDAAGWENAPDRRPNPTTDPGLALDFVPPGRRWAAIGFSCLVHMILVVTVGLWAAATPKGTEAPADRKVGIALVHRLPDRDRYTDARETVAETAETPQVASDADAASAPPADFAPPLDLDGILADIRATPLPRGGEGIAGDGDLGAGDFAASSLGGEGGDDGSETTTMVFGVSGTGSRFAYVFDRSDSMNGYAGAPLRAAKAEMIRSLESLTERQQFGIVFYNDSPTPFRGSGRQLTMINAETAQIGHAVSYVRSIRAYGGTEHESAIKLALRMSPDVIFFLTDARIPRLSRRSLGEIERRAAASGTTIHAIEFGGEAAAAEDSFLKTLARQNRGEYRYVDVRTLGSRR